MYWFTRFEWGLDEPSDGEGWATHEPGLHACGHRGPHQVKIHHLTGYNSWPYQVNPKSKTLPGKNSWPFKINPKSMTLPGGNEQPYVMDK